MTIDWALWKGVSAGMVFLLATYRPKDGWTPRAALALAGRIGAGLAVALVGTEAAVAFHPGLSPALAAAVLMAFGLKIAKHIERAINAAGKKVHGQDDTGPAPLDEETK